MTFGECQKRYGECGALEWAFTCTRASGIWHKESCHWWFFGFQQDIGGGICVNVVIWVSGSMAEDVVIRPDQQRRKEAPVVNRNLSYSFYWLTRVCVPGAYQRFSSVIPSVSACVTGHVLSPHQSIQMTSQTSGLNLLTVSQSSAHYRPCCVIRSETTRDWEWVRA